MGVSTKNDWDAYVSFFAQGLGAAAEQTRNQMTALVKVQAELKDHIRASGIRADSAHSLVDLALTNPTFGTKKVETELKLSYTRANALINQLVGLGVLAVVDPAAYKRRFYAPRVLSVLQTWA